MVYRKVNFVYKARTLKILATAALLLLTTISHVNAIENGVDATGTSFSVPIKIQVSSTNTAECTGALIAPSIVVTAGHCVLDVNGLLTKAIYVGEAGSSMDSITTADTIDSVQITSSYSDGANQTVANDDLAFITLSKPRQMTSQVALASESQVQSLSSSSAPLKIIGYGNYHDAAQDHVTFPNSIQGIYSQTQPNLNNSAFMASTKGDVCQGDSGSPVISTTATQITIVGIVTGGALINHCTKIQPSGVYLSLFTLIGRYANLAFASALNVMTTEDKTIAGLQDRNSSLTTQLSSENMANSNMQNELDSANSSLSDLQTQLDAANANIFSLQKKLPATIVCIKGKISQKLSGVLPKCPTGFKLKNK